jgi:two-component system sensor histidine kinase BaeS
MFRTLRARFVLSHLLPLLLVVPLMGLALTYVIETQVLLQNLSTELQGQAVLIAQITGERTEVWYDPVQAQALVAHFDPHLGPRVMLLDAHGLLLASNDPADAGQLGQSLQPAGWAEVVAGGVRVHTSYSRQIQGEVVAVLVPVVGPDQQVTGVVRLSHQLADVSERFVHLRTLIAGVLAGGLVLGVAVGWLLALNLERPLQQITQAVRGLTSGEPLQPLAEQGPAELRLLSRSVNALVEQLRNLEQARRQLLANLVHELGRPLGALRSAIQALRGGADEEAALRQELLAGMDGEVDHLRRLLDDLNGLQSQVLGSLELERRTIFLSEWLAQVLAPWRESAQAKGLRWQADIPANLPPLQADPDRLAQAVGNLLSNAVKFTPDGGAVSIGAGEEGGMAWIRVGDTGPGITLEEQERVFAPFYRSQPSRRFPQGMGLGLTIARDLVAAHGGRLEMESTPGAGSAFTIRLPLTASIQP